jgi:DnaJ like chaperone protein
MFNFYTYEAFLIDTIDDFFRWIKSAEFINDLVIRLIVLLIVGGMAALLWFISVPILLWYFYKKFGNKRISGCKCHNCNNMNSCDDNFCISCGSPLGAAGQQARRSQSQTTHECSCSKCNGKNDCDAKFCINCGSILNNNSHLYDEIFNSLDGVIVALLSKIAKIDGRISSDEATYLSSVFDMLSEKRDNRSKTRKIYKQISEKEKGKLSNVDTLCSRISYFDSSGEFRIEIIRMFVELAYIDGNYDRDEENIIVKIVHNLKIDFSIYQNIKDEFEPKQQSTSHSSGNLNLEESYKLLESKPSDSMDIIKKNYRRLVRQYHYDSIISKDLPKDMLDFAEAKSKAINAAYDKIKKSRG